MPPAVVPEKLSRHQHHHHYALPTYGEYYVDSPSITSVTTGQTSAFDTSVGSYSTTSVAAPSGSGLSAPLETVDLVFCDPIVFRHLEEDSSVQVVYRNRHLFGYEVYMVEQWVCTRNIACKSIATYTGDPSHRITVSVLRIPHDETRWSPRLRCYFNDVRQSKAKAKDTELGTMMVTNLSNFPSEWVVVLVPGGDVRDHRHTFMVNEDLKRLGCSGRTALSLAPPTESTQVKFYQMFKIAAAIEFNTAVVELVRTCQLALMAFGLFTERRWIDGLLCNTTEKCLLEWWSRFGSDEYNVEPSDGILGPTTVAGLLGMLLGARARLNMLASQVPKDALDIQQMMKAVRNFQHGHRLETTGYLDRTTLSRLRKVTSRDGRSGAGSDIFAVPRAIRSGIADLGSRAVGGSTNQVDLKLVETVNFDHFIANASGETCKFLWQGKPKKTSIIQLQSADASRRSSGSVNGEEAQPPATNTGVDPVTAVVGAISSAPVSSIALNLHQQVDTTPPPSSALTSKTSTGLSARDSSGSGGASGVFRSMTGRMKKAGAEFRSSRHQQIGPRRSVPKDLDLGYQASPPRTATPPLAVVTAPSSPKLTPQLQPQPQASGSINSNDPHPPVPPPLTSSPQPEFSLSRQSELRLTPEPTQPHNSQFAQPIPSRPYGLEGRGSYQQDTERCPSPRPPLPSLRRPSLPLPQTPHHDEYFPRRMSFSLALDTLSTTTWTLPFSPPSPPLSPPHLPTITWAEHHLAILTSRTHTLSAEADSLEKRYKSAEEEVKHTEDVKRHVLRAVEEAEAAVGGCKYESAMTEARVRDLEDAVIGMGRKVRELEREWEEVQEEKGWGRGKKKGKEKSGDAAGDGKRDQKGGGSWFW